MQIEGPMDERAAGMMKPETLGGSAGELVGQDWLVSEEQASIRISKNMQSYHSCYSPCLDLELRHL